MWEVLSVSSGAAVRTIYYVCTADPVWMVNRRSLGGKCAFTEEETRNMSIQLIKIPISIPNRCQQKIECRYAICGPILRYAFCAYAYAHTCAPFPCHAISR